MEEKGNIINIDNVKYSLEGLPSNHFFWDIWHKIQLVRFNIRSIGMTKF